MGDIGVTLGTYGPLQMVIPEPIIIEPELIWSGCHVVPATWVIESTSMETGQSFRWLRDIFYESESGDVYSIMEKEASTSPAGSNDIKAYMGPRLPNYRSLDFNCTGGFITQLPPTPGRVNRKDFARAVLEAVAYGVKLNVDRLQRISELDINILRVCGGLSNSRTLMQIIADLVDTPVFIPKEKEGSALGAAICAGVGAGIFNSMAEGANILVQEDATILPQAESGARYQDLFHIWMQDYKKMYGERILEK
jgi:autoinducer 2 (AI-2) kinase